MSASLGSLMSDVPAVDTGPGKLTSALFFLCIGGFGALAFVVLSTLMIWLDTGLPAYVVNALCYASLIVPVYLLHRRFSFQSDASHWQALPRYLAVQVSALLLAALFTFVIHGVLGVPTLFASMLVICLTSGVNYFVLRSWAFARAQFTVAVPA